MKSPFGDAVVLLVYLLPGFLAMQLYRARYPGKRISQFEFTVWSVLHSFVVNLGLSGLACVLGRHDLDPLGQSMSSAIEPKTIAVLLGGGWAWGCILIAYHWIRIKLPLMPSPDRLSIWPVVAADAHKEELWALVRTRQGALYLGWIKEYSFDPADDDHDFTLRPASLVDENLNVQRDLKKGGVYLNTRDIDSFELIPGS